MELYDRSYFESDDQTRGYRNEGYRDFAAHYSAADAILAEKPESVVEIGAARGYVMKIIEANGIPTMSLDVSPHCYHTRAVYRVCGVGCHEDSMDADRAPPHRGQGI